MHEERRSSGTKLKPFSSLCKWTDIIYHSAVYLFRRVIVMFPWDRFDFLWMCVFSLLKWILCLTGSSLSITSWSTCSHVISSDVHLLNSSMNIKDVQVKHTRICQSLNTISGWDFNTSFVLWNTFNLNHYYPFVIYNIVPF